MSPRTASALALALALTLGDSARAEEEPRDALSVAAAAGLFGVPGGLTSDEVGKRAVATSLDVRAKADAGDTLVGIDQHDRHRCDTRTEDAVGVPDRPTPVVDGR